MHTRTSIAIKSNQIYTGYVSQDISSAIIRIKNMMNEYDIMKYSISLDLEI